MSTGLLTMATKKAGRPGASPGGRKAVAVTLKGDPEWKAWLEGLAAHCRLDVAKVIDKALVDYAKREGYEPEAPQR